MTGEPETWLGNIEEAARQAIDDKPGYCLRCGIPHDGPCLRGSR